MPATNVHDLAEAIAKLTSEVIELKSEVDTAEANERESRSLASRARGRLMDRTKTLKEARAAFDKVMELDK